MTATGTPPTPGRCAAVWGVTTVAAGSLQWWLLPGLAASLASARPARFEGVLVAGCEVAALACSTWLWLLVSLVVLDLARGRGAARRRGVPRTLRRAVLAACGLSLAGGLSVPVQGAEGSPDPESVAQLLVGLPLPDRTTSTTAWVRQVSDRPPTPLPARARNRPTTAGEVTVRPGDTLWDLAAATLPHSATETEIDRRWRQIYQHNRSAIGADPDLIRPGQRLALPPDTPREEPR